MKEKLENALNSFLRVRAYLRYSSTMQDDGFSIEYQQSEINDFLEKRGMELQHTHIDQAQTAKKVAGRDEFHQLVRDVKEGLVDVIIVFKMNRMFRNSEESEYYRRIFRKHNVKLISVTENIDDDTSSGRLTTSILSNIDQYTSEVIADHVRAGLREMGKQGLYTGRPVLIGYDLKTEKHGKKKRKRFIVNEEEAVWIRKMYQMYNDGFSLIKIADYLNAEGFKTKRGNLFSKQSVRRILENEFYMGVYRFKVEGYDEIVLEDCVPALVSKELFMAVQERKTQCSPKVKGRKRKRVFALTGKIYCGKCGAHFYGSSSYRKNKGENKDHAYYTCATRKQYKNCDCQVIKKGWIEERTIQEIRTHILNDEKIDVLSVQISNMAENSPSELQVKISELKAQKFKLEKKYSKFVATFLDEDNDGDNLLAKKTMTDMQAEMKQIEKQLFVLSEQLRHSITPESIREYLEAMLAKASDDNIEVWQILYEHFVENIIVTNDNVEINLRVFPSEKFVDKISLALPIVSLSAQVSPPTNYFPKKF